MSRSTLVLVALIALVSTVSAVDVRMSFSNGADTHFGRFGTAGLEASGSLESVMAFDMSGAMVDYFGHQDIVGSKVEMHGVISVVDGHRHSSSMFRNSFGSQTLDVDGDVVSSTFAPSE